MTTDIDVTRVIDHGRPNGLLAAVIVLCTLVTLADGYNISVVAFAAPAIAKAWGLTRASLGPLFSSSLLAGLIGPYLFGILADRKGRRLAVMVLLAVAVYRYLPESPKFLSLRPGAHAQLGALLRRFDPTLRVGETTRFQLADEVNAEHFSYRQLFAGKLAWLTPLLWLGSFVAMIDFQALNSWLPTLLTDSGLPFARAAIAVVLFQFVGTLGGWAVMRPVDALGMLPCTILYALSIPAVGSIAVTLIYYKYYFTKASATFSVR
jgi:MFS family permease